MATQEEFAAAVQLLRSEGYTVLPKGQRTISARDQRTITKHEIEQSFIRGGVFDQALAELIESLVSAVVSAGGLVVEQATDPETGGATVKVGLTFVVEGSVDD